MQAKIALLTPAKPTLAVLEDKLDTLGTIGTHSDGLQQELLRWKQGQPSSRWFTFLLARPLALKL
jgi:hypothetical protein